MTRAVQCLLPPAMLVAVLLAPGASTSRGAVTVQKKPAVVEHKTFDPTDKPAEMPPLSSGELAVTTSQFDCSAEVQIVPRRSKTRTGRHTMSYTVNGVKMMIELKVVVWNPANARDKLKAHEEGHREISETIYKTADAQAKAVAQKLDGRRIVGEGDTPAAAQKAADEAMRAANQQVCEEYMELTSRAGVRVQTLYDDLTGHGMRPIAEKDAIQQAFAKEAEDRKRTKGDKVEKGGKVETTTAPATKPARRR
jgi:hypothetical protein